MPGTKTLRIRNCIHTTIILHFHLELMSKSVSPKTLGLELIKLDCIIIKFDLVTIKKARNELDDSCGLSHVFPCVHIFPCYVLYLFYFKDFMRAVVRRFTDFNIFIYMNIDHLLKVSS